MKIPTVRFADILVHLKEFIRIDELQVYKRARIQLHWQGMVLRDQVQGAEIKTKKQQVARAGELLVAEIDAKVGGIGIVPAELDGAIVSSHYFLFQVNETKCLRSWLGHFIRSGALEGQLQARGSTNYAAIRPHHILQCELPLPPLDEQRRIVARIEELSAKIEEARGLRRDAAEHARALLPSKTNTVFRLDTHASQTRSLDEICTKVTDGEHSTPRRTENGRYLLSARNIQDARIDLSVVDYVDDPEFFRVRKRCDPSPGDVLISCSGSIGKIALVDRQDAYVMVRSVAMVRPMPELVLPEYLAHALRSGPLQDQMRAKAKSTAQANLFLGRIKSLRCPVPPIPEQRCIVEYLDRLQAKIQNLKKLQEETWKELNALMPSILSQAFNGEL